MNRNPSPILRRELENLEKDADSRRAAMKALKLYVKDLDSKAIPVFLAQVSETKETGSLSGEYTISLYEVLARVHGVNIVPQIDSIMATIIKTLTSSAGSFPLQQACSKVVPAVARYGMDPTTPAEKKRDIIHSLCKPLSDSLLGFQESLTSGAALCLKSLVDCDNWRFASDEVVNKVCQNVAVALESKSNQTNSHMGLVMSLAKRNPLIVEAYARLLIHSGIKIMTYGVFDGNSQKRFSAIQMLTFLMKCLDPRSIYAEVDFIIEEMEKCQTDPMAFVRGAAYEAMQAAKRLASEEEAKFGKGSNSVTGSNFSRGGGGRRRNNTSNSGDRSPDSVSPESQTVDSFTENDSLIESPNSDFDCQSVNRKLWSYESGGVDESLKDGLFEELGQGSSISYSPLVPFNLSHNGDQSDKFTGFFLETPRNGLRSATPSPQRSRSRLNMDDISIYTTPRKLIRSLQDPNNSTDSELSEMQNPKFASRYSRNSAEGKSTPHQNGSVHNSVNRFQENGNVYANNNNSSDQSPDVSESVISTEDVDDAITANNIDLSQNPVTQIRPMQKTKVTTWRKAVKRLVLGILLVLVAVLFQVMWSFDQEEEHFLVPT